MKRRSPWPSALLFGPRGECRFRPRRSARSIAVEELTLPNGMRFLLFERHESPTVAAGWVARVGSANERPGITGLSHFFEHMMFKGTTTIGTKDIAADLRLIDEQEAVQEQMRAELEVMREAPAARRDRRPAASPRTRPTRYRELQKEFARPRGEAAARSSSRTSSTASTRRTAARA